MQLCKTEKSLLLLKSFKLTNIMFVMSCHVMSCRVNHTKLPRYALTPCEVTDLSGFYGCCCSGTVVSHCASALHVCVSAVSVDCTSVNGSLFNRARSGKGSHRPAIVLRWSDSHTQKKRCVSLCYDEVSHTVHEVILLSLTPTLPLSMDGKLIAGSWCSRKPGYLYL